MTATLTIRDESLTPGFDDHVFELEFPTESITVREIIRERIYQEVDDVNRALRNGAQGVGYRGLVAPSDIEQRLNDGRKKKKPKLVDWKAQFELATDAYEHKRILVLVGDRQTESLDEVITITAGTEVTFIRLVMLVGG